MKRMPLMGAFAEGGNTPLLDRIAPPMNLNDQF